MTDETLFIITDDLADNVDGIRGEDTEVVRGSRDGWGQRVQKRINRATEIPVATLEANMGRFLDVVARLFQQADQKVSHRSNLHLEEVELQVEISGKGEVKLLAGGEASGKGVITLKFKRQTQE